MLGFLLFFFSSSFNVFFTLFHVPPSLLITLARAVISDWLANRKKTPTCLRGIADTDWTACQTWVLSLSKRSENFDLVADI